MRRRGPRLRRSGLFGIAAVAAVALAFIAGPIAAWAGALRVEALTIHTGRGAVRFQVEIADTDATRERGLMFRKSLAPNRGMLFDFHEPRLVAFWMKNTLIPLDMLFIDSKGVVVSIARQATPMSETPIPSGAPVVGVLEIAGGRAAAIGVQPGDKVDERIFRR